MVRPDKLTVASSSYENRHCFIVIQNLSKTKKKHFYNTFIKINTKKNYPVWIGDPQQSLYAAH